MKVSERQRGYRESMAGGIISNPIANGYYGGHSGEDVTNISQNTKYISNISLRYSPSVMSSFVLVSLNIDAILAEITVNQRRKKLDEMTKGGRGLGNAYAATISRIKAQQRSRSKLGMEVLVWILHSERPSYAVARPWRRRSTYGHEH